MDDLRKDGGTELIDRIPLETTIYEGYDAQTGQLKFANRGRGYAFFSYITLNKGWMGPAVTLALGLTECCAYFGHGKVYYFNKPFDAAGSKPRYYPLSYTELPSLLYVDFEWDAETRKEWLNSPHWERVDLLSARGNMVDSNVVTLPISLYFELDNYDNIQFCENIAAISMTFNAFGFMYLGFTHELVQHMKWYHSPPSSPRRPIWQGAKVDLAAFQMRSGREAVRRLYDMYQAEREETLWLYSAIRSKAIQAHADWVTEGGYTIAKEPLLGPAVAEKVRQILQGESGTGAGERLQELRAQSENWPSELQQAYLEFSGAAVYGVAEVAIYTIENQNWIALNTDQKKEVVELWRLEEEYRERQEATQPAVATRDTDEYTIQDLQQEVSGRMPVTEPGPRPGPNTDDHVSSGGSSSSSPVISSNTRRNVRATTTQQVIRGERGGRSIRGVRGFQSRSVTTPALPLHTPSVRRGRTLVRGRRSGRDNNQGSTRDNNTTTGGASGQNT